MFKLNKKSNCNDINSLYNQNFKLNKILNNCKSTLKIKKKEVINDNQYY